MKVPEKTVRTAIKQDLSPLDYAIWDILEDKANATSYPNLHVNAQKTEYMSFNQGDDISTQVETSLKLVDKFSYLGSSVSSTEKDIDTWLTKAWTAIDSLSII